MSIANSAKTVVATGASSGLGFEAVKQLLFQNKPYRFILGCRNTKTVQTAYNDLGYDTKKHSVTLLPLELSDFRTVKKFANQTIEHLGTNKLDYLMLNAAVMVGATAPAINGSKYNEQWMVNHFAQHYLIHLLRETIESSRTRIVVVSSGAIRNTTDPSSLDDIAKVQSGAEFVKLYSGSKFCQLLGAQWWARQLQGKARVVACSPGMIPGTGLGRHVGMKMDETLPDAKSVETGAQSILAAFTSDDFPEDPEQIFLTSWGEWWPKDTYQLALDKTLQDKWCPSLQQIEKDELTE